MFVIIFSDVLLIKNLIFVMLLFGFVVIVFMIMLLLMVNKEFFIGVKLLIWGVWFLLIMLL